jgi:hypothetical protein
MWRAMNSDAFLPKVQQGLGGLHQHSDLPKKPEK